MYLAVIDKVSNICLIFQNVSFYLLTCTLNGIKHYILYEDYVCFYVDFHVLLWHNIIVDANIT